MTTVSAGASDTYTFSGSGTVALTVDANEAAQIEVRRSGAVIFSDRASGPRNYGPFLSGDVMTLTAQRAAIDYVVSGYTDLSTLPSQLAALGGTYHCGQFFRKDGTDEYATLQAQVAYAIANGYSTLNTGPGFITVKVTTPLQLTEINTLSSTFFGVGTHQAECYGLVIESAGKGIGGIVVTNDKTLAQWYCTASSPQNMDRGGFRNITIMGPVSRPISYQASLSTGTNTFAVDAGTADTLTAWLAAGATVWVEDLTNDYWTYQSSTQYGFARNAAVYSVVGTTVTVQTVVGGAFTGASNWTGSGAGVSTWAKFEKDSCAGQFGGVSASRSDITGFIRHENVQIAGFHTALRYDDSTLPVHSHCDFSGNTYGVEGYYNIDCATFDATVLGGRAVDATVTTSTSTSLTVTAFPSGTTDASQIFIGSYVADKTNMNGAGQFSRVVAGSGSTLTLNKATTTGAAGKSFRFMNGYGTALVGSGPWRPGYNSSVGSPNNHQYINGTLFGGLAVGVLAADDGLRSLNARDTYSEGCYCLARLGSVQGTGQTKTRWHNHEFSHPESFQGRGVFDLLTAVSSPSPSLEIIGSNGESVAGATSGFPCDIVYSPVSAVVGGIDLYMAGNVAFAMCTTTNKAHFQPGGGTSYLPYDSVLAIKRGANTSQYYWSLGNRAAGTYGFNSAGMAGITMTATGSGTYVFSNPTTNGSQVGQLLNIVVTASVASGVVVSFGTNYVDGSGAHVADSAASASASQIISYTFRWSGTKWVLQHATPSWFS